MSIRIRLLAAASLALAFSYPALAAEPSTKAGMSDEISALKARLEQLEAKQQDAQQQRQAAEQKSTTDQLVKDADQSDHFMVAEGFTAGYTDDRFVIQSADKNFVFRPWLHMQFREVVLDRTDNIVRNKKAKSFTDEVDQGFEMRRMRFGFDGNLFTPDVSYFFNWATVRTSSSSTVKSSTGATVGTVSNNLGGVPLLEEAWVKYHLASTPYSIRAGQIKDPVLHDQIVSSRYQQGAERSLTADIFTNGDSFTEAVTFIYDPQSFIRTEAGVNHGMRSANTNFLDYPNNGGFNSYDYGFVGRVEYKVFGKWKDYGQVGAVGTKAPLLVFGAGADYSERGRDGQLVAAADAMYADQNGLSLYGAFVDRYTSHNFGAYTQSATGASIITPNPAVAGRPTNEYAIVGEVGYIIDRHIEPFGRYEYMHLQGDAAGSHNWIEAVTAGVNYYYYGNRLKLTAEATWLPNGLPFDDGPNDILANTNGRSELGFIAQLQLLL